jgi:hypothetical protein
VGRGGGQQGPVKISAYYVWPTCAPPPLTLCYPAPPPLRLSNSPWDVHTLRNPSSCIQPSYSKTACSLSVVPRTLPSPLQGIIHPRPLSIESVSCPGLPAPSPPYFHMCSPFDAYPVYSFSNTW